MIGSICPAPSGPNDYFVTMSGLTLANASRNSDNDGGAIGSEESLALLDMVISGNKAKNGGGLVFRTNHPFQQLFIQDSQFLGNIAKPLSAITGAINAGGAIYIREQCPTNHTQPVDVEIVNTLFSGNRSQPVALFGLGGAIASVSSADISISNSRFVGNGVDAPVPAVPGALYGGGAIFGRARSLEIDSSEISGNTADVAAGLFVENDDPTLQTPAKAMISTIINSTISGNMGVSTGGALMYGNVALEFDNSTLASNTAGATFPGGIAVTTGPTNPVSGGNATVGTLTLVSTIVGNNSVYDIAHNTAVVPTFTVNATNSLIETPCPSPTCMLSIVGAGNKTGVDPVLGPLANNGGTTQTMALLAGSPALNAGSNPLALAFDQRGTGFPRVIGGVADMGAYESAAPPPNPPVLQSAVSRRVHGAAGTFNLPLTLTAVGTVNHAPTTEARQGPNQTIVFTFDKPLNAATVAITEGAATTGAPTFSGNDVIVGLTGVTNQQYVTVTLSNVASTDGGTGGSGEVRVGFLLGDVNQSRVVSVGDLGIVNSVLAQVVNATNYLKDVNVSGTLSVADKGITNANLTKALPPP
jgi:hypothetical protein